VSRDGEPTSGAPDGVTTVAADLRDPASLTAAVGPEVQAVIHLATPLGDQQADEAALEAIIAPLRGTGRALVYTSGAWVLGHASGSPHPFHEQSPTTALPRVGYRPGLERLVLDAADDGVRGVVVRPGVAHGRAGGIPALLVDLARQHGTGLHVGDGQVRWPMVHVDDLADLFTLALREAPAGQVLHGVAEEAVDTTVLAAAAARAAGVSGTRAWPLHEAATSLGLPFAEALACDQRVSAAATRELLGWQPHRMTAVADLERGSYREPHAA
jgi:nucleoside-diphosphate-sugar epimerase